MSDDAPLTDAERAECGGLASLYEKYALVADDPAEEAKFRQVARALREVASTRRASAEVVRKVLAAGPERNDCG